MSTVQDFRRRMSSLCASLFQRDFSVGRAGNLSAGIGDDILMPPTNATPGGVDPARLSKLDAQGRHIAGDMPTKEAFLYRAFYRSRSERGAVVHLHSTWVTALSYLEGSDPDQCIPLQIPYVVMRGGTVKRVPHVKPGDPKAGDLIAALKGGFSPVCLPITNLLSAAEIGFPQSALPKNWKKRSSC